MNRKVKYLVSSILLSIITLPSVAQCEYNGEIDQIFQAKIYVTEDGSKKLMREVARVDVSKCYAKAVNTMPIYFDYLMNNFSDKEVYKDIDLDLDSAKFQEAFKSALNKDEQLKGKLDEHFKKLYGQLPKDTVLFAELQDVAVKFFTVKDINENGYYVGKVCTGVNLMEKTLPERMPFEEAMAFTAILGDLKFQHSAMMTNFEANMKELYNLKLGIDEEERLLRAQGVMMHMMKQDAQLSGILAYFYAKHLNVLPFVLDQ